MSDMCRGVIGSSVAPLIRTCLVTVAVGLMATFAADCGSSDRSEYVKANERLFQQLPTFPGSRLYETRSSEIPAGPDGRGPIIGYGTTFKFKIPAKATHAAVLAFYERRLRPEWRLVWRQPGTGSSSWGFILRKGNAGIGIDVAGMAVIRSIPDNRFYENRRESRQI